MEKGLPPLLPPSDDPAEQMNREAREAQRKRLRQRDADPIRKDLRTWRDATRPSALPKSALGVAIGYALNNWTALARCRDEGYPAIDNILGVPRNDTSWSCGESPGLWRIGTSLGIPHKKRARS